MRYLCFSLVLLSFATLGQEIPLSPGDPTALGSWAQAVQALRLFPTPATAVRFEGPALSLRLFGEILLGGARYPFLLGVNQQNEVSLWLDRNRDGWLVAEEELPKTRYAGAVMWTVTLSSEPGPGGQSFPYPLQLLWPEGRSYVFVVGGAPKIGEFQGRSLVVVDGDVDGVFGTKGDFLGLDVDGDGRIYAELDGHERFWLTEPFTLEDKSYLVHWISPDANALTLEPTQYVPPKVPLIPGARAPDFSFRNFLDGRVLSLAQFRGKVVLLDFWATWCPPCMAALPQLRALYQELHSQGFEIVGVSLDENGEDLRRVLTTYEIPWPNAFFARRWDNLIANLYRVHQIPTTYLLDKRGVIRFRDVHGEELRTAILKLLAEADDPQSTEPRAHPLSLAFVLPEKIQLNPRGATRLSLDIVNGAAFSVEDVKVVWEGLPVGVRGASSGPFALAPGEKRTLELILTGESPDTKLFPRDVFLRVSYRYRGQSSSAEPVVQRVPLQLVLATTPGAEAAMPWWVWGLLALGLALAVWMLGKGGLFFLPVVFAGFASYLELWLARL